MAHAILETQVSELLYDLSTISYPAGRVAFGYRNASDRFQTIINLLDMQGITPIVNLKRLKEAITACCTIRDTLAHNVWIRDKDGHIVIRAAKGTLETPEGKVNFQFLPAGQIVPDKSFAQAREKTIATIAEVLKLKAEAKAALQKQKPARA
jgi:hypothetical protein